MKKIVFFLLAIVFLVSCNINTKEKNSLQKKTKASSGLKNRGKISIKSEDSKIPFEFESLIIKLTPYIPLYNNFGNAEVNLLKSRLNAAIAEYGFGGGGSNPRFIIGPAVNILYKETTSTAPTLYAITYEVDFLICDVISKTVFSSYSVEFKGIGETPAKSFISGFREVDLRTEEFYDFIKTGEEKIIEYYNHNCNRFIEESKALYNERNYDEAYVILKNIPFEANTCFDESRALRNEIFNKKLNSACNEIIMKMKAEFGKFNDPSASGYNDEAMAYYALIDRESNCYEEAQAIYNKYISNLDPKKRKMWNDKKVEMERQINEANANRQYKMDSLSMVYEYMNKKAEFESRAEIEGNKKLLEKYKKDHAYEKQPWIRKLFHLGDNDPFDGYND